MNEHDHTYAHDLCDRVTCELIVPLVLGSGFVLSYSNQRPSNVEPVRGLV